MQKRFWGLSDNDPSSKGGPGPLGVCTYPCLIVPEQWPRKALDSNALCRSLSLAFLLFPSENLQQRSCAKASKWFTFHK